MNEKISQTQVDIEYIAELEADNVKKGTRVNVLESAMQEFVEFMAYFLECESTPSHEIEPHVDEMKQLLNNG